MPLYIGKGDAVNVGNDAYCYDCQTRLEGCVELMFLKLRPYRAEVKIMGCPLYVHIPFEEIHKIIKYDRETNL